MIELDSSVMPANHRLQLQHAVMALLEAEAEMGWAYYHEPASPHAFSDAAPAAREAHDNGQDPGWNWFAARLSARWLDYQVVVWRGALSFVSEMQWLMSDERQETVREARLRLTRAIMEEYERSAQVALRLDEFYDLQEVEDGQN